MRISSRATLFNKRLFPVIWFGTLALTSLAMIASALKGGPSNVPWPALIVPALMFYFGYQLMKKLVFDLVDEVWEEPGALLVRNAGLEQRIPFSNIEEIDYQYLSNPPRVTLRLREAGQFGESLAFMPPQQWRFFRKHPKIVDLIARVRATQS